MLGRRANCNNFQDTKGRLPRAKVTYKVGRNVAGQLR